MTAKPRMRRVIERVGRHLVRLQCLHLVALLGGELDAIGRRLPSERCAGAELLFGEAAWGVGR